MTGKKIVVPALKHGTGSPIAYAKKAQLPNRSTCDGQPLAFAKNNPEGKEICLTDEVTSIMQADASLSNS